MGRKAVTLADHLSGPIPEWRLALIADNLPSVLRDVPAMEARYPGFDVEPIICQALYLAAFTWIPGRGSNFQTWYKSKRMGNTYGIRRTIKNRCRAGIPFEVIAVDPEWFDEREFNRD